MKVEGRSGVPRLPVGVIFVRNMDTENLIEIQPVNGSDPLAKKLPVGPLAVVGASFLWSLDGYLRRSLYSLPSAVIVFWEHLLGGVVALLLVGRSLHKFKDFTRKQWWSIVGVSLLSGALGTMFYTQALTMVNYIPFSVVVLLQQLQPLFTIGLAKIVLKERIDWRFMVIAIIALLAAYGVSFPTLRVNLATGTGTVVAALFAIAAAASWGSSTVLSKFTLKNTSHLHVTAARFWLTPFFALAIALMFGNGNQLFAVTSGQFGTLLAITFSTGFAALVLYYFGLQKIPASVSTILELTWPISALLVGSFVFHDHLTLSQWISTSILIGTMTYLGQHRSELEPAVA